MSNASAGETPHNSCKMRFVSAVTLSSAARNRIFQEAHGVWNSAVAGKVVTGRRDAKRPEECANSRLSLRLLSPLNRQTCLHHAVPRAKTKTTLPVRREHVQELELVGRHKQARHIGLDMVESVLGVMVWCGLELKFQCGKKCDLAALGLEKLMLMNVLRGNSRR